MNNLKRVLSLGLTGAMLSGMMLVGASAASKDFTDADEITHTEAVSVMSTLGVLAGKDTGAFDPNGTVTRAEMAKIICVMRNGGVDPTLGSATTSMFSDTANHWARSYIEYCANLGIIAGQGDGTFNPDGQVTGAAAAKMLLVAMGYDSDIFGFTGIDWELNVNYEANDAKLYDEIKGIDTSVGLSRDNTAQMAYNALDAYIMDRSFDKVASSGEITYKYDKSTTETFLNKYFGAYTYIGQMTGNTDTLNLGTEGQIQVYGKLDTMPDADAQGNTNYKNATFPSDLDISNIGEEVKVIFKDGKGGTAGRPDKNDTIYGVFNTGRTEVINATLNDIKDGSDAPKATDKIKIGSDEYTVAAPDSATQKLVVKNYDDTQNVVSGGTNKSDAKAVFEGLKVSQSGDTVKFVCNDDGEITNAYVVNTKISYVSAVNGDKVTINGVGAIKISDNDIYDGIAKNDVVTYTKFYDTNKDDAYFTVTKAESVSGEMTAYKQDKGAYVNLSLDGTTYKTDKKTLLSANIGDDTTKTSFIGDDIGEDFTAYMVNGYVGYVIQNSDSANKLALVIDMDGDEVLGSTLKAPKVQLLLADGTKVIVSVDEDSVIYEENTVPGSTHFQNGGNQLAKGAKISNNDALEVGQIVRYSVTSSGTYKLVEVPNTGANGYTNVYGKAGSANTLAYEKDTKSVTADNGSTKVVTDGSCVLFVQQTSGGSTEYKAYNIRNLNDVKVDNATNVGYVTKDGKALAAYVELDGRPSGASGSTVYGIVASYNGTTKDSGTSYKSYTVENDQESYTVLMDENSTKIASGNLVAFEPAADNIYNDSDMTVLTGSSYSTTGLATWVKEYSTSDKTLTYWSTMTKYGAEDYRGTNPVTVALDDDCVIAYVNADDGEAGDDVGISEFDSTTGYRNVVLVKDSTTSKVVGILVESSRDADIIGKSVNVTPAAGNTAWSTATNDTAAFEVKTSGLADGQTVSVTWYGTDSSYTTVAALPTGVTATAGGTTSSGAATVTIAEGGTSVAAGTYYFAISVTTGIAGETLVAQCVLVVAA